MVTELTYEGAFVLILLGVILRMLGPALRKRYEAAKEGEKFKWDHRYTWATLFSLAVAFIATLYGIVQYVMPPPETHWVVAYAITILEGIGLETIVVEIAEWVFEKKP